MAQIIRAPGSSLPVGTLLPITGRKLPADFIRTNGQGLQTGTYDKLYSAIGDRFNTPDIGPGYFGVPGPDTFPAMIRTFDGNMAKPGAVVVSTPATLDITGYLGDAGEVETTITHTGTADDAQTTHVMHKLSRESGHWRIPFGYSFGGDIVPGAILSLSVGVIISDLEDATFAEHYVDAAGMTSFFALAASLDGDGTAQLSSAWTYQVQTMAFVDMAPSLFDFPGGDYSMWRYQNLSLDINLDTGVMEIESELDGVYRSIGCGVDLRPASGAKKAHVFVMLGTLHDNQVISIQLGGDNGPNQQDLDGWLQDSPQYMIKYK